MSSGVFSIRKDGSLVEMQQSDYESEDTLQSLLVKYPNLLAGNLINETNPRKWLLISREYGIPDKEESNNRWAIDHLFLDQDGIPTLIEVKRSNDTRIRREVVGQMLEYAANAVQYWSMDGIRAIVESRCAENGIDSDIMLGLELDIENEEEYWEKVKTNLQIGKIRLLFVADEIPIELKRIVEFLNEQMNNVEVLAIEIKKYSGQEQTTLIPRIYGHSLKSSSRSKPTPSIEEHLDKIDNENVRNIALQIKQIILDISSDIKEKTTQAHIVYYKGRRNLARIYPQENKLWVDTYIPIDDIKIDGLDIKKLGNISHFEVFENTNMELVRKALQSTYDYLFVNDI